MKNNYSRKLRVNPDCSEELKCWCYIFNCSEVDILAAIRVVGDKAWMVQQYINKEIMGKEGDD